MIRAVLLSCVLFAVLALSVGRAQAVPLPKDLVKAQLLAGVSAIEPGKPFTVAIRATIAPKWHIYWLNPGDSGMATAAKLDLPVGWTHSDWRFPVPHQFDQPGDFVGYGYTDEVVLLADITPPLDLKGPTTFSATLVYLVCENICIPGRETLWITLPSGPASPDHTELIGSWEARMPAAASADGVTTTGKVELSEKWSPLELKFPAPKTATAAVAFPLPCDEIEFRNIKVKIEDGWVFLRCEAKPYTGQTVIPTGIRFLLGITSSDGHQTARWVDLPTGAPPALIPSAGSNSVGSVSTQPGSLKP